MNILQVLLCYQSGPVWLFCPHGRMDELLQVLLPAVLITTLDWALPALCQLHLPPDRYFFCPLDKIANIV